MSSDYWGTARFTNETLGIRVREVRTAMMMSQPELVREIHKYGTFFSWDVPSLSRIEMGIVIPHPLLARALSHWLYSNSDASALQAILPPPTRGGDPQTSHDAAKTVTAETMRKLHHWWIQHLGRMWQGNPDQLNISGTPRGYHMTDEGARKFYDEKVSDSGFRTRRAELRHAGFVEDSGKRYEISTGRLSIAWRLTPTGYTLYEETPHDDRPGSVHRRTDRDPAQDGGPIRLARRIYE